MASDSISFWLDWKNSFPSCSIMSRQTHKRHNAISYSNVKMKNLTHGIFLNYLMRFSIGEKRGSSPKKDNLFITFNDLSEIIDVIL